MSTVARRNLINSAPDNQDYRSPGNAGDHGMLYDLVSQPQAMFAFPDDGVQMAVQGATVLPVPVDVACKPIESRPASMQPGPLLPVMTEEEMHRLTMCGPRFITDIITPAVKHV